MIAPKCFVIILLVSFVHASLSKSERENIRQKIFRIFDVKLPKFNEQPSTLFGVNSEQEPSTPVPVSNQKIGRDFESFILEEDSQTLIYDRHSLWPEVLTEVSEVAGDESTSQATTDFSTQADDTSVAAEATETSIDLSSVEPTTTVGTTNGDILTKYCILENVTYTLSDSNQLTIAWNTKNLLIRICQSLLVELELTPIDCSDDCSIVTQPVLMINENYTFPQRLEACAIYDIRLKRDGVSVFTKEIKAKEQFEMIEMTLTETANVLNVSWAHTRFPLCDNRFLIEVRQNNREIFKSETTSLSGIISDLEPCEQYVVSVYPMSEGAPLVGYGHSINHTMRPVLPSQIRALNVTYDESDYSIRIDWQRPEVGSQCVKQYEVKIESDYDNRSRNITATQESFTNVYACVDYMIKIKIWNIMDMEAAELEKDIRIPSRVFAAPTAPRVERYTSTSVFLITSVSQSNQRNYCAIKRTEFNCINGVGNAVTKIDKSTAFELTGLTPYTEYHCFAKVENIESAEQPAEFSPSSEERIFRTEEGTPDMPTLHILNERTTAQSFALRWDSPINPNGVIKSYNVYIKFRNFSYYNPSHCNDEFQREFDETVIEDAGNNFIFNGAFPYSSYYVQVQAVNGAEESGYTSPIICETLPAPSNQVRNFSMTNKEQVLTEPYNRTTIFTWRLPCRPNGNIVKFEIECHRQGSNESFSYEVFVSDNREEFVLTTEDLLPDSHYRVVIKAITEHHEGEEFFRNIEIEAGVPDLSDWEANEIIVEPSTKMAKLTIPTSIFDSTVGRVQKVYLLLAELDCGNEITSEIGFNHDEPEYKTWKEAAEESCIPQYLSGSIEGDESTMSRSSKDTGGIVYTIGTDICETTRLCNGPLKPGKNYALILRAFTSKGFSDTEYIKIKTEKETPLFLITVSILSVMCIVFVIGFYVTYRRTRALRKQSNDNSPTGSKDVSVSEFANFHRDMVQNNRERIKEEYKALQSFSDSLDKTCIASIANEKLNRYSNISPFDYNRVVLNDDDDFDENDYINASYINGYHYPREYIAAQGPKPNTGHDFWRMVLQHKVESIAMLTSLIECDKLKCHEYFPKLNGQITFADIKVRCKREEVYPTFIKRVLVVEKNEAKLDVKHYYFTTWPDHGVPSNAAELIDFCKIFRSERQKLDGTVVVHCSAGVGRTGTFIALDIIMQRMKQEKKINIYELVQQLRSQRMKMVQCLDQYIFLYTCGLELTEARRKQPQVFQNIALFLNELKVSNRLKKGSKTIRASESSF